MTFHLFTLFWEIWFVQFTLCYFFALNVLVQIYTDYALIYIKSKKSLYFFLNFGYWDRTPKCVLIFIVHLIKVRGRLSA